MAASKPVAKKAALPNKAVAKKAVAPASKKVDIPVKKGKPLAVPDKPTAKTVATHTSKAPKAATVSLKKGDVKPSAPIVVNKGTKVGTAAKTVVPPAKKQEVPKIETKQKATTAPEKAEKQIEYVAKIKIIRKIAAPIIPCFKQHLYFYLIFHWVKRRVQS